MSDFDRYPGQGCPCGNDPACHNCNAGAVYEEQMQQEEAERRHREELHRQHYGESGS